MFLPAADTQPTRPRKPISRTGYQPRHQAGSGDQETGNDLQGYLCALAYAAVVIAMYVVHCYQLGAM